MWNKFEAWFGLWAEQIFKEDYIEDKFKALFKIEHIDIERDLVLQPNGMKQKKTKQYNTVILRGREISSYDIRLEMK